MKQDLFTCHACHHLTSTSKCEHCGSEDTATGSCTLRIKERVNHINQPMTQDLHRLTNSQIGYRLAKGFSMLSSNERD